jgi:ABC-type amino acid transport substrate-binding protein
MTMTSLRPAALALGLCAAASAVAAQNVAMPPTFGTLTLSTGGLGTPGVVDLIAGGGIYFELGACSGYVADAPDFRVLYSATAPAPLSFAAESGADTVLLINAPDGSWHCNDDFYGLDPAIGFDMPLSGQYDIWVGTYDGASAPPAALIVAENWLY